MLELAPFRFRCCSREGEQVPGPGSLDVGCPLGVLANLADAAAAWRRHTTDTTCHDAHDQHKVLEAGRAHGSRVAGVRRRARRLAHVDVGDDLAYVPRHSMPVHASQLL